MYSTRIVHHTTAPRAAVYRACLDPNAIAEWLVPDNMTSEVHTFEPREGGRIRISLTYKSADNAGKTSGHTDTFHGTFVRLVPDREIVQTVEFETDDPALRGTMTQTVTLDDAGGGTDITWVHDGVPDVVPAKDNETGTRMSVAKLAAIAERSMNRAT